MDTNEKLMKLRKHMKEHNLKAYIVSDSDPHMSEYVAKHWKMRSWLSGFTGSAGTIVITDEKAGLWTDGRYYIQAEKELSGSEVELFRMGEEGVPTYSIWLIANLDAGDKIGIYGEYFPAFTIKRLRDELGKYQIELVTDYDLVGEIWHKREPMPIEPIFSHDIKYAGKGVEEKLKLVRERLAEVRSKYYIIGSLDDIAWLYNIRGADVAYNPVSISYALISDESAWLFIDPSKIDDTLREEFLSYGVIVLGYEDVQTTIRETITSGDSIYLDPARVNYGLYNIIADIGADIIEGREITGDLKAIKNDIEIENFRRTLIKDGVAMVKFLYWLENNSDKGITEIEAAKKIDELRSEQLENKGPSFTSISAYKDHGAMMHYSAKPDSQHTLKPEGFYLLDSGGQYLGGTTDITRTVALGPISDRAKKDFTLVLKGNIGLSRAKFLYGATGSNLDVLARRPIWEYGIDYKSGTGHGIGFFLNVHEGPQNISQRVSDIKLEAGMIISNEPGIYREGEYGIRTENLMLVVEDEKTEFGQFMRFEILTLCPIDIDAIDAGLLGNEEKTWLNNYHKRVYNELSPYLEVDEKNWLKEATREI
ncbi:MAG: aminopeptidase P family protein [Clostridiales bacterium]|nr:aminopeptidase P family protein [Clostridiales bacterium]